MTTRTKEQVKKVIRLCHWKYIARDKSGELYLFEKSPYKYDDNWMSIGDEVNITGLFDKKLFSDVKWNDLTSKKLEKYLD